MDLQIQAQAKRAALGQLNAEVSLPRSPRAIGFRLGGYTLYVYVYIYIYMGGCQNYGPFLGTLNIRCRIIIGIQKGTIILTTTYIYVYIYIYLHIYRIYLLKGGH